MRRTLVALLSVLAVIAVVAPVTASVSDLQATYGILRADEHRDRAVTVPKWDPSSPQELVRLDGVLYQESAGLYFEVIPEIISARLEGGIRSWDELVSRAAPHLQETLSRLTPIRKNRLGIVDLQVPEKIDLVTICEIIDGTGLVRYAEVVTRGAYGATQTDPLYGDQWALNNTGQSGGTPGADIDAELAWDLTAGDPSVIVAILDSGTDVDHEDLAANVWHNAGENPTNGVDDDGNGYIDDWEGWDFDNNNNDPRSGSSHGTFVTGIVNAAGSNGVGVAGIAGGRGGPGVRGMALGIGATSPNASVLDDAIVYAADNGARVITISVAIAQTQAINDALDYAYNVKDVFIDCAAGNASSAVSYPATRSEVMAVAATNDDDSRSWFSNLGPEIEVAAPGEGLLSTQPGDGYTTDAGTSFAAPYVAGLAGLIRGRNPGLSAADVRQLIMDTAEDVEDPGFDILTGWGRINAHDAVAAARDSNGTVVIEHAVYSCDTTIAITVSDYDLAGGGTLAVTVRSDTETADSTVLSESGGASGVFRGSIEASSGTVVSDGRIQVTHGDTVVVEYLDANDGGGGINVLKTDTASIDCVGPVISQIGESIADVEATVTWTTDLDSTSEATWGETVPPTQNVSDSAPTTAHTVQLTGLQQCTDYFYSVGSEDDLGNLSVDDNAGAYYSLQTWGNFAGDLQPCHEGRVLFDGDAAACAPASLAIRLSDIDLNTDAGVAETVTVWLTSTTETTPEAVVLTETGPDTSTFAASVPTGPGPAIVADGILQTGAGDLVTARYEDADDGTGHPRTSAESVLVDCEGPGFDVVTVTDVTDRTATVVWTTTEPTVGYVDWGTTPALGTTVSSDTLQTAHALSIGEIPECGRVYFRVVATDARGNTSSADDGGTPHGFNAGTALGVVFSDGFETDTGWTLEGEWEIAEPQGLGTSPGDPASAFSGARVMGHDLSGQGTYPGDYEVGAAEIATSPVIDASGLSSVQLSFKAWVNEAPEGIARVEVRNAVGTWLTVYQTTPFGSTQSSWANHVYDISSHAAGNPAFQVRFRQMFRTTLGHHAGWNVDALLLRDPGLPDYGSCGGCAGAPAFAGVVSVTDDDPCADSGVTLAWAAAPSWGTGATGTYAVYRDTVAGFTPGPANRVASGIVATTWIDPAAPADLQVWYVVRAENDETCATGPANDGVTDDNLIYGTATNATSQAPPGDVGATLYADPVNRAHVRLSWSATSGAAHYRVYRANSAGAALQLLAETTALVFEVAETLGDGQDGYYEVRAADACGNEGP